MARIVPESIFLPPAGALRDRTLNQAIKDLYLILARAFNTHVLTTDPAYTTLAPTESETLPAGTSAIALGEFTIPSGVEFAIEAGSEFLIL